MKNYLLISIIILGAICSLLCSCRKTQQPASAELKVAATIFPVADIVKNIGADKVQVMTIMPPGASPHTFEPTFDTIQKAQGIKALFKIGCGLDEWSQRIVDGISGKVSIIPVSKDIKLRHFADGSADPHYWLSLENGSIIAKNITDTLIELDPPNKDFYLKNLSEYQLKLTREDQSIRKMLSGLPHKTFVTFHEAWFYFAQAYGLKVAESFEPFPGKEPSPAFLAHFVDVIKKNNIRVVFIEPQLSPESIRQIAADLNLNIMTLDPEGGGSPGIKTYIDMMRYNAEMIYKALSE